MNLSLKVLAGASAGLLLLGSLAANTMGVGQKAIAQQTPKGDRDLRAQAPINRIRIVFANRRDATDLQNKANQVAAILSKAMGIPVEAVIGDETAAVEALRANRADVAFVAGRAALKAEQLAKARMYLAEVRSDYSGGNTYDSVFVVRQDSPLRPKGSAKQTLEQLKGKKIAFTSRTSGSGFIFPVGELVGQGLVSGPDRLESFFGNVTYGDGYGSALQAVLKGQAEVATVSEYALLPPWITAAEGKQLRVLQQVPGVPAHGIVIDDRIPAPMREKLINAFLTMNEPTNNSLFRSLYNSQKLVKVDHNTHLATLSQALKRAKLDP
ncbi:MAG: phosphate/phosphite/phosphonate ABC transporter substrate-binding protein [Oscillatoriales cyanobacterium]|uniref:phosphate/phosphite/phosphonate ABC transporter substrate-binding protein n=1 Tax=Microcoleus anatoxicus TaxID=2705319 RepID=UPI002975FCE5|nr:MAG: phosphate/phosphite/phosphonate ABC transporter substrate-binding protein [Oscillatoriales cyanobacterium]TAD92676.1 MAG: phosphate/phosphite/phosphonate ABC transporter substrate-binding protein [Oscillatoriales cyanobacterium]TAE02496.1 MAG: phosphate/phosphite/phosphonate ABC transporter substrate-binding protein [Oscillatoriales cyanobacterium]TAF32579.1 MAG: phosphate/phosphite/phosphonate ABC transporter substrate-binding protein [Oscillatoriales cyanobacterium]